MSEPVESASSSGKKRGIGDMEQTEEDDQFNLTIAQQQYGLRPRTGSNEVDGDAEGFGEAAFLNDPVPVVEAEEVEDGEPKRKKSKKSKGNFILKCVGEEVSEDSNTATVYHFKICLENLEKGKNKERESTVYDVEITQDNFAGALKKWTKQIKTGLLFCPGGHWAFAEKIQLAILKFQERETDDEDEDVESTPKEKLRIEKEGLVKMDEKIYFISGRNNIFLFTPEDAPYVKKLTKDEIEDLPVKVIYTGKEVNYDCNPAKGTEEVLEIISLFNENQRPHNRTSFVYGLLQNLKAELYEVIDDHRVLVIYSKTTNSGKTVLMEICDILFNGAKGAGLSAGCTEAGLRNTLGEGLVGRFDEIDLKDIGAVTKLQKGIWQPKGGLIHMANETIRVLSNVVITTNLYPHEILKAWKITHPDLTKYDFNHLGEAPMELVNDEFQEDLDKCVKIATSLHKQKPFLLALGYAVGNKRVTGAEIAQYDDLVGVRSSRFTQGIVQLTKFCKILEELASDYLLEDKIPDSLSNPTYSCILKAKSLVARQSERRPMDLISEICKETEEARKYLIVTTKGRKGIAVWTGRLKESKLFKQWMQEVYQKLEDFDSTVEGNRVRGKLVPAEDLEDLYDFVVDLITVTVERSLIKKAKEHQKNTRKVLAHLKDDILKFCTSDRAGDEISTDDESEGMGGNARKRKIGQLSIEHNNLLASEGMTLVASKGKSLMASKGKSLVASKGKSLVTSKGKSLVASKGKSMVASKGKSLVTSKGKSLVASKDKSLVARKGASLVANNDGSLCPSNELSEALTEVRSGAAQFESSIHSNSTALQIFDEFEYNEFDDINGNGGLHGSHVDVSGQDKMVSSGHEEPPEFSGGPNAYVDDEVDAGKLPNEDNMVGDGFDENSPESVFQQFIMFDRKNGFYKCKFCKPGKNNKWKTTYWAGIHIHKKHAGA